MPPRYAFQEHEQACFSGGPAPLVLSSDALACITLPASISCRSSCICLDQTSFGSMHIYLGSGIRTIKPVKRPCRE